MKKIILLFMTTALFSKDLPADQEQVLQAAAYAEAGDPDKSAALLEALIDPASDEWQKRRIRYDIGTSYLYAGDWEEALLKLQPLAAESSLPPLLEQRLTQNLAYARLLQANDLWKKIQKGNDLSDDAYYSLLILLKQTSLDITNARLAWCALSAVEGAAVCPPADIFDVMNQESTRLYTAVSESYDQYRSSQDSSQSALPAFLSKSDFGANSLENSVAKLLAAYKFALIKDPIVNASLMSVQESQNALETLLKSTPNRHAESLIKNAQTYLKRSIESSKNSPDIIARLNAEAAMSFIRSLEQQLFPPSKSSGESVLKLIISKQEFVKRMTQLRFQAVSKGNDLKDIDQLITDLQNDVVESARTFPEASIAQQHQIYDDPGANEDRCQCSPWDDVVPLFDEGFLKARHAASAFNDISSKSFTVMLQAQAIEFWKEALAALREPKKKKSQEAKQEQTPPPEKVEAPLNDILRYVQQMEKDDESRPQGSITEGHGSEERPW